MAHQMQMKHCGNCRTDKPVSEFNKNSRKSDGLQTQCRPCTKISNNASYKVSPKRRNKIKERNNSVAKYARLFVTRYKRFCGCRLCGEREPVALDLHHLNPNEKDDEVARLMRYGMKVLKAEIRKCAVLCANCHRKVHAGILTV